MDEELEIEAEREQMRRLQTLRKVVGAIVRRHIWALSITAVVTFAVVLGVVARRVMRSADRYQAETALIYSPREAGKIRVMDNQEVLRVITRKAIYRKLSDALQLSAVAAASSRDIEIEQSMQPRNMFGVFARAPTEDAAVRKVNALAEICVKEYIAYRMADLESWLETILVRKKEMQDQITKCEEAETALSRKYGVSSPSAEADRISRSLGDRRAALIEGRLQLASAELKKKKVENELKAIDTKVVENADLVKRYLERRQSNEAELSKVRSLYAENNPRYLICKERCEADEKEFTAFLAKYGIKDTGSFSLERYSKLQDELKDAAARVELLRQGVDALGHEIERLEKQMRDLVDVLPEFDRYTRQRETLRQTLDDVEDTISDVRYLESTCGADLTQIETAMNAEGKSPFGKKSLLLAFLAMAVVTSAVFAVILLIEMQFGVISGATEVTYHSEMRSLGAIPVNDAFADENEERNILDGIFYRFRRECTGGTLFAGMLPGAVWSRRLDAAVAWNLAMGGTRVVILNIVRAFDFVEPENAEFLGGVVKNGDEAWLPVTDSAALSPGEIELLKTDLAKLREEYDTVLIRRREPLRRGEIFLSQMAALCDRTLVHVGSRRTKRRQLQNLIETVRAVRDAEILCIVTGVHEGKELKEGNFR